MTKDELTTLYDDARDSICSHEFRSAFDSMRRMGNAARTLELLSELDTLEQRYFYMLRFISEGNKNIFLKANAACTGTKASG